MVGVHEPGRLEHPANRHAQLGDRERRVPRQRRERLGRSHAPPVPRHERDSCCTSAPTLSETDIGVAELQRAAMRGAAQRPPVPRSGRRRPVIGRRVAVPLPLYVAGHVVGGYARPDFVQIDDTNNSVTQNWLLNYGAYYSMYPEVGVRPNGDMSMVTDEVSPSTANNLFASAWVIGIPNQGVCTVCTDGPAHFVAAGAGNYQRLDTEGRNRWGDYSGAAPDPDSTGIWAMGQYATNANTYGMQVQLTRETGDATPPTSSASLSPAPNSNGWNNSNVTVTIHATDAGSGVYYQTYSATGAGAFGTRPVARRWRRSSPRRGQRPSSTKRPTTGTTPTHSRPPRSGSTRHPRPSPWHRSGIHRRFRSSRAPVSR